MQWHPQIEQYLIAEQYNEVTNFYEHAIEESPDNVLNYWYLGLAYLISEQEELAQTTWMFGIVQAQESEEQDYGEDPTFGLKNVLIEEIKRQRQFGNTRIAWVISQHLREIAPTEIKNLFEIVELSIELGCFEPKLLKELNVSKIILDNSQDFVDYQLLLELLRKIFEYPSQEAIELCKVCLGFISSNTNSIPQLLNIAVRVGDYLDFPEYAADLLELCLEIEPHNTEILKHLCNFSTNSGRFQRAIEVAKLYGNASTTFSDIFLSNYQLLKSLTRAGLLLDALPVAEKNKELLRQLFENQLLPLSQEIRPYIITSAGLLAYSQDDAVEHRYFQNNVGKLFTENHNTFKIKKKLPYINKEIKIKIGYIGSTLRSHSVGWLCRWLFKYHDRNRFEITTYLVNQVPGNHFYEQWFKPNVDYSKYFDVNHQEIANQIYNDEVDILIDLDSITLNITYEVMALKPAPIQVSWLGWDAPGLSTVDYFIADPYVLPTNAQTYYQESIWRLPETYVAIDGFEVGTPDLTRQDLNIPSDAVVFYSSQAGSKRHPETVRLQMKILKEVPESYFLIKAIGDGEAIEALFIELAEQEGVSPERLRFISFTKSEYTHRANLQLVDIVLDTYPYNGATTTLETLWVGIPLVTRVGNTFSARNSYSFMVNAGLSEGISWTDAEYVDWGVRLGRDEKLRQTVTHKLRKSRQASPLWNTKQFAGEMENAYRKMWQIYLEKK